MEELVLGKNMWGAWCSDPARLLLLLFSTLFSTWKREFLSLRVVGSPQVDPAQCTCAGFGSPPAALCLLNGGSSSMELLWFSALHHLTVCRSSCKAG